MNKREKLLIERGPGVAGAYQSWVMARFRINNPTKAKRNGTGYVGLTFCKEWDDFEKFLSDMGERPDGCSIDRINNDVGYEPSNCRWSSCTTQSRNRKYVKLSEDAAAAIRAEYISGCSQQSIADKYGVSQVLVSKVVRNQHWKSNG